MKALSCTGLILLFNIALGGYCFDYCLYSIAGKDIPWYADVLVGLVAGQFVGPLAFICWIVRLCGVAAPFCG